MTKTKVPKKANPRIIVTGCGHSGTRYFTQILRAVGIDARHEFMCNPFGPVPKKDKPQAEVSWLAANRLTSMVSSDVAVWHLVRHPLRVANSFRWQSFFHKKEPYSDYVRKTFPELDEEFPELDYWLDWNYLVSEGPRTKTISIETMSLRSTLEEACALCSVKLTGAQLQQAQRIRPQGQTNYPFTYDKIQGYKRLDELIKVAGSYGYDLSQYKTKEQKDARD